MKQSLPKYSYQEARKKIQSGDFLVCSGEYLVSKAIKKASKSEYSHIGLLVHWNQRILLSESVEDDGVRFVPLSHYTFNYENTKKPYKGRLFIARHRVFHSASQDQVNRVFGRAADLLNCNYDKGDIAKIVARISLGMGRRDQDDAFICSEFVAECMKEIGVTFPSDKGNFIYPEHIVSSPQVDLLFEIRG